MPYTPLYTSISNVEDLVQFNIDDSSIPDQDAVLVWIEQVESRVVEARLATHTATNEYINVMVGDDIADVYSWEYDVEDARLKFNLNEGIIVPLGRVKYPVISITTLEKNDEDPDSAASWDTLTEGPGASTHFFLLTTGSKNHGYALWIYDEVPEPGPRRLRATYSYGWAVDSDILGDWCALGVAIKILVARMGTNEPDALASLDADTLGSHMNTNYAERIGFYRAQQLEIEAEYFPAQRAVEDTMAMEIL